MALNIEAIMALSMNWVYGHNGTLPWRLRDDLVHFRTITQGHAIVMGRLTYESLPKQLPLPNRLNMVMCRERKPLAYGFVTARSATEAINFAQVQGHGKLFVIGGLTVWEAFWDQVTTVHLTRIPRLLDGDCRIPVQSKIRELEGWSWVAHQHHQQSDRNEHPFTIWRLSRNSDV